MPANLPPGYYAAEKRYRETASLSEKIEILKEMLAIMPKHKGTDKLQADIKTKIAKLKRQPKSKAGGGGQSLQGALYTGINPQEMKRTISKQAEAEREKRAKIIHAEGEYGASHQLAQAAERISENPVTLQLRYLQTLTEIASEKNSTILFPLPIELFQNRLQSRS